MHDTKSRLEAAVAPHRDRLATPALIIDLDAVDHNIAAMLHRCGGDPTRWRPHIKTVKQAAILARLLAHGLRALKCATLAELALALTVADAEGVAGVDVLLAFPLHEAALRAALALAARHPAASLTLLIDSPEHARWIDTWSRGQGARVRVLVDVDVGMRRTGAPPARWLAAAPALAALSALEIVGVHGYDGHLGWDDVTAADAGHDALVAIATRLAEHGAPIAELVTSGSHTYAAALAHPGLAAGPWSHRVSPGTIVLSDRRVRAAALDLGLRQAAFVAARVVSHAAPRVTLDAGTKALSPDRPPPTCEVLGWPDLFPLAPSEEHLPVHVGGLTAPPLGHLLFLIPDHVCTTVNLHRAALLVRGAEVVGESAITAGHTPWLPLPASPAE